MRQENGKICYLEIPASDVSRSSEFHGRVFGGRIKKRADGQIAFDYTPGQVSGAWVLGRSVAAVPGLLFYVSIEKVDVTLETIVSNGVVVVQSIGADAPESTARFRYPAGNIIGVYQQPA